MTSAQIITIVTLLVGGGGIGGFVYALLKIRPEAGQFTVTAAQGVVVMQADLLERMEENYKQALAEIAELRGHMAQVFDLQQKVRTLEHDNELLRAENTTFAVQVKHLQRQVAELQAHDPHNRP